MRGYIILPWWTVLIVTSLLYQCLLWSQGVSALSKSLRVDWNDGYFVRLGALVGGPWLGGLMMLAAAVTNIGE